MEHASVDDADAQASTRRRLPLVRRSFPATSSMRSVSPAVNNSAATHRKRTLLLKHVRLQLEKVAHSRVGHRVSSAVTRLANSSLADRVDDWRVRLDVAVSGAAAAVAASTSGSAPGTPRSSFACTPTNVATTAKRALNAAASAILRMETRDEGDTNDAGVYCCICREVHQVAQQQSSAAKSAVPMTPTGRTAQSQGQPPTDIGSSSNAVPPSPDLFTLSSTCGHTFCRAGLAAHVRARIRDGDGRPACCHTDDLTDGDDVRRGWLNGDVAGPSSASDMMHKGDDPTFNRLASPATPATVAAPRISSPRRLTQLLMTTTGIHPRICKAPISEGDVRALLSYSDTAANVSEQHVGHGESGGCSSGSGLTAPHLASSYPAPTADECARDLRLYDRLLASRRRPDERECPAPGCGHRQVPMQPLLPNEGRTVAVSDDRRNCHPESTPAASTMTCESCGCRYCYHHSNAHAADVSCALYEQRLLSTAAYQADMRLLKTAVQSAHASAFSAAVSAAIRTCPGVTCGALVQKESGCNHMRCPRCGTAFCWLCGSATGDNPYPDHFAWWNLSGCPNKQMTGKHRGPFSDSRLLNLVYGLLLVALLPAALTVAVVATLAWYLVPNRLLQWVGSADAADRARSRIDGVDAEVGAAGHAQPGRINDGASQSPGRRACPAEGQHIGATQGAGHSPQRLSDAAFYPRVVAGTLSRSRLTFARSVATTSSSPSASAAEVLLQRARAARVADRNVPVRSSSSSSGLQLAPSLPLPLPSPPS